MNNFVLDFFKANDVKYYENYPMARLTAIKLGGPCDLAVFPDTEEKLVLTAKFLSEIGLKYKIVGKMSNILPTDGRYDGIILATDRFKTFTLSSDGVIMSSGATFRGVLSTLSEIGLSGYEELVGIPGCIGGLVVGNAGAFSREIADLVKSVRALDLASLSVVRLDSSELAFSYRESIFKSSNYLVLDVVLKLVTDDKERIKARVIECRNKRALTQPIEYPSLGSTFKRCADVSAAELIDKCGLKGRCVGGAAISEKHAGFIINRSGATAEDVKALINIASDSVYDKYGLRLEREIEFLGD